MIPVSSEEGLRLYPSPPSPPESSKGDPTVPKSSKGPPRVLQSPSKVLRGGLYVPHVLRGRALTVPKSSKPPPKSSKGDPTVPKSSKGPPTVLQGGLYDP